MNFRRRLRRAFQNNSILRYIAAASAVVLVVVLILIIRLSRGRTYTSYTVETSEELTEGAARYEYADGYVLRYSSDGATLLTPDLDNVWTAAYDLSNPKTDICGSEILIYDLGGTGAYVFDRKGKVSSFTTDANIRTARVSSRGTVALLTDSGETTQFLYYSSEGNEIAEGESTMIDPGYAFALAISPDGLHAAVSYFTAANGTAGTTVRFYGFDSAGQQAENNQVGEISFDGVFAPELTFLSKTSCAIFCEDGFSVVKNISDTSDVTKVDLDEEVISIFYDQSHLGFIVRSSDRGHLYEMRIYSPDGKEAGSDYIDYAYSMIRVCGDKAIVTSSSEFSIYTMQGKRLINGTLGEGSVSAILALGGRDYLAVTDQVIEKIRLE